MLPIYICEDENALLKQYTQYIQDLLSFHEYEMNIVCSTDNPEEVLNTVRRNKQKGIYFLDIHLGEDKKKEGIYLGEAIRQYDPDGYIVYITSHSEMSMMILRHRVAAIDFIPKEESGQLKSNIANCLALIHERDTKSLPEEKTLALKTKNEQILLKQSEIYYIEMIPGRRKIAIHTQYSIFETNDSLSSMESRLCEDFIYCHKSILVNLKHIQAIRKRERRIIFDNNSSCDIAVRSIKKVAQQLNALHLS